MEINIEQLKRRCLAKRESFFDEGVLSMSQGLALIHKDRGEDSTVLGIAHLDTVRDDPHFQAVRLGKKETIIHNAQLDDRMGVYIMLDLLPSIGVNCDVLLTDGEESGRTTAARFTTKKKYAWIFSFDRRGDDVVMYSYEDAATCDLVRGHGFRVGSGSFSCIERMQSLEVKGFNFGCGYHNEHNKMCYASLRETYKQVGKFRSFWQNMRYRLLPHIPKYAHHHYSRAKNGDAVSGDAVQYTDEDWTSDLYVLEKKEPGDADAGVCSNPRCHRQQCQDPCNS